MEGALREWERETREHFLVSQGYKEFLEVGNDKQ